MGRLTGTFFRFLGEWAWRAGVGYSKAAFVAKLIVAVILFLFAMVADEQQWTANLTVAGEKSGEAYVDGTMTFGVLVAIVVIAVWVFVAYGVTWSIFCSLKIGGELQFDSKHNYWRMEILNRGNRDVKASGVMTRSIGRSPQPVPWHLIDLAWTHSTGEENPPIPPGESRLLDVFAALPPGSPSSMLDKDVIKAPGKRYAQVIADQNQTTKVYVQISVRGVEPPSGSVSKWFSLVYDTAAGNYVIECEDPPAPPGILVRLKEWWDDWCSRMRARCQARTSRK